MSLVLHGYWRSSASYRVRIALNLKQLAYQYQPVHLVKGGGEQKQAAYSQLNPAMLVPTFVDEDEDVILNQSLAIIEYLDEKHPEPCPLLPAHKLQRARVRALSYDLACDIQPIANLRVLNYLTDELGQSPDTKASWSKHWIGQGFSALEKRLQNTAGDYCFGFELSMADVVLVPQVYNALRFGVDMQGFPLIERVYQNCNQLDAFDMAKPENQPDAS